MTRLFKFENFAQGQLASAIGAGDVSFTLGAGEGDTFPVVTSANSTTQGFYVYVTEGSNNEWMLCTTRESGSNQFTVTRADTSYAFGAGAFVNLRMKSEILESFLQKGTERSVAGSPNTLGTTANYAGEEVYDSTNSIWYKNTPGGVNTWEAMNE